LLSGSRKAVPVWAGGCEEISALRDYQTRGCKFKENDNVTSVRFFRCSARPSARCEAFARSKALDTDDSYSFTFTTPGTYQYFCYLHPHMVGSIVVESTTGSNATQ
jgi:hypothetical protein